MARKTTERASTMPLKNVGERIIESHSELRDSLRTRQSEKWLRRNKKAMAMVQEGLKDAKKHRHSKPPNLAAAAKIAAKIIS